ncbi:MAG: class I SAM-dependent RNA methyltransferase [Gemmatimonadaceae bacterium]
MSPVVTLAVDSIAAGGDGVGRSNGLVVFVPRTAAGDIVTASIAGKGQFARGSLRSVTRPSRDRTEPPCPHYTRDRCGGCQLQHITYPAQIAAKQLIIRDAIVRIGKRELPAPEVRESRSEWRYRTKLTLAIRRRGISWIAGLRAYDDPSRVFSLADCPITDRGVVRVWRDVMNASSLFPDAIELRGSVRLSDGAYTFSLQGGARWGSQEDFFAAVPSISDLWWEADGRGPALLKSRDAPGSRKKPGISFAQVNPSVASELHAHVVARALSYFPSRIVDAYSGAGATAIPLAGTGASVTAIELDQMASDWCARQLPEGSRAVRGRVEDELRPALPADVVLLNPPRAGIDEKVAAILEGQEHRPRAVIYVSCNPATLARDISRLPSYRIASVVAFDMFPQTAHVETVCELVP